MRKASSRLGSVERVRLRQRIVRQLDQLRVRQLGFAEYLRGSQANARHLGSWLDCASRNCSDVSSSVPWRRTSTANAVIRRSAGEASLAAILLDPVVEAGKVERAHQVQGPHPHFGRRMVEQPAQRARPTLVETRFSSQ